MNYKVEMLEGAKGSPNGIQVLDYKKGEVYELNESLYKQFVNMGVVKLVEKPKKKKKPDDKAKQTPFNKMMGKFFNKGK